MTSLPKSRPLTKLELASLADQLRTLLGKIEGGTMEASTATRYRIEGAVAALDVALGVASPLLADLTSRDLDNK